MGACLTDQDVEVYLAGSASPDGTIKLWETGPPTAGRLADRQIVGIARGVVDELYETHTFATDVIESLRADEILDTQIRNVATEIATARGDNAYLFNQQSRAVVIAPDQDIEAYALALRKANAACHEVPDSATYRNTLGIALYRLENYQEALGELTRADKTFAEIEEMRHPRDVAFLAMTHAKLDHLREARKELGKLKTLMQDQRWANDAELIGFVREAEGLIRQ